MLTSQARTGPQSTAIVSASRQDGTGLLDKFLPATYETYRKIRRQPTVSLARALCVAPVVAAEWSVKSKDGVDDFRIRFIREQMMPIRDQFVQRAMETGIDYGWSAFEKVFTVRSFEGRPSIMLRKLKDLLPDLTDIAVDPNTGAFAGFVQPPHGSRVTDTQLGIGESLLIPWRYEGTQWYGEPLLEYCRRQFTQWCKADAGAERYDSKVAGSTWAVYYPWGQSEIGGEIKDNNTIAAEIIAAIEAAGAIAIPQMQSRVVELNDQAPNNFGWKLELIDHTPKQGSFVERMSYLDKLFVRALLLPERSVIEGEYGTKAEATVHTTTALALRELEHKHITRMVNWHVVDQILAVNFGDDARGSVYLEASPLVDTRIVFFQDVYKALLANPIVADTMATTIDLDSLTDALDIPKSEEVVQPIGADPKDSQAGDVRSEMAQLVRSLVETGTDPNRN